MEAEPPKRRPGRPRGSKTRPRAVPLPAGALTDYKHADPMTLISRQFSLIDWQQQALRADLQANAGVTSVRLPADNTKRLVELSNSLVRTVDALRKANNALEELQKNLTPQQLLEAALKKIEGQDVSTLRYAIARLGAYLKVVESGEVGKYFEGGTAMDALTSLED